MTISKGEVWLVNLDKPSAADTFQVRSVSVRRFARRLGQLPDADMTRIMGGLKGVLDL